MRQHYFRQRDVTESWVLSGSTRVGKGKCGQRLWSAAPERRVDPFPGSGKGQAEKSRKAKKLTMFGCLGAYQPVGVRRGPRRWGGAAPVRRVCLGAPAPLTLPETPWLPDFWLYLLEVSRWKEEGSW